MSDLIDREYAIKRFCEDGTYLERHGVGMMTLCEAKQRAVDLIESFPSAQPERKKGEWLEIEIMPKAYDIMGVRTWASMMKCDTCGFETFAIEGHMAQYHFCPSCGARMDGESDD